MITVFDKIKRPPINRKFLSSVWEYVVGIMESSSRIKATASTPDERAETVRTLLESGMRRSQIAKLTGFCSSSVHTACLRIGYHDITIKRRLPSCKATVVTLDDGMEAVSQSRMEAAAFLGISEKNLVRNLRSKGKPKGRPAKS